MCMERLGNPAQHAQRMAFVSWRLKATDLLLGRLELARKPLLRESCLLAECRNLQRHIPCFTRTLKTFSKARIFQLLSR